MECITPALIDALFKGITVLVELGLGGFLLYCMFFRR